MPAIHYAISFGQQCRPRYQLKRVFRAACASGVFDWQITPAPTVLAYLAEDFSGMFELDDLYVNPATGFVTHRTFGTVHQHEFPEGVTDETLTMYYDRSRRRHDYLCSKLRRLLSGTHPLLIAVAPNRDGFDIRLLDEALTRFNPRGTFHLLQEPEGGGTGEDWRGSNEIWDVALRPYTVPALAKARALCQRLVRSSVANFPRFAQRSRA